MYSWPALSTDLELRIPASVGLPNPVEQANLDSPEATCQISFFFSRSLTEFSLREQDNMSLVLNLFFGFYDANRKTMSSGNFKILRGYFFYKVTLGGPSQKKLF